MIALILHSCYRLAKLGMEDWLQWVIAAVCFVVTVILQAEVALLFIGAGIIGILYYGNLFKRPSIDRARKSLRCPACWRRSRPGGVRLDSRQAAAVLPQGGLAHLRQRARDRAVPEQGLVAAIWLAR